MFVGVQSMTESLKYVRVAFTGKLVSMTRKEALQIVSASGGEPCSECLSKDFHARDWAWRAGLCFLTDKVSRKLHLAEKLNTIRIISESAFLELVGLKERQEDLRKTYSH